MVRCGRILQKERLAVCGIFRGGKYLLSMKITVGQLRTLIRESLAVPKGAAVNVYENGDVYRIILWSPELLESLLSDVESGDVDAAQDALLDASPDDLDYFILGMIGMNRLKKSPGWSNSSRGWEAVNAAAKKGYGPLMFNFAVGDLGAIVPDRKTMTDDSARVWKKFETGASPNVTLKPLDDEDNPKTKSKKDDGPVLKRKSGQDMLFDEDLPLKLRNSAAVGAGIPTSRLQARGRSEVKRLAKTYGLSVDWIDNVIDESATDFFESYFEMGQPD